ncbi:MAG: bile acid:sodium symporter family protein [Wenzhouxiangellaceae bacterium]
MFEFYLRYEYTFAATQLVLAMLGMGATLRLKEFAALLLQPRVFMLGCAVQLLVAPLLGLFLIELLGFTAGMAIAIALIVAIPGGTVSNIFTYFARGHVALSITITAVTTVACLLTTPLILTWLSGNQLPAGFHMPAQRIALEIGLTLLLPLAAGMLFLSACPRRAQGFASACIRASLLVIALIVIGSLGAGRLDLDAFGLVNLLVIAGLLLALMLGAAGSTRLAGMKRADRSAVELEVVVRNINLGLLINASLFPAASVNAELGNTVLFALLVYGGLQLVAGGLLIAGNRWVAVSPT